MMFDFFRERTQEGFDQVKNIATKTLEGRLGEALQDSADYIKKRQAIDYENLKQLTIGLSRSRDRLLAGISDSFSSTGDIDDLSVTLSKLEDVLLQADIGVSTTNVILEDLRKYAEREGLTKDDILPVLRARLIEALTPPSATRGMIFAPKPHENENKVPTVIFVIGANGMGKTTTIGKIASRLRNELNMTVLLGACDTFRAAAVEQLCEWSKRANVSIEMPLESERGGDPVPVVTRSVQRAIREQYDAVIIDTSGRLSNNYGLTMQLKEMKEAIQKVIPTAPHETLLVVDGSLGRNAVEQAAAWRQHVGVTGLVITKLDGTARGGFVVSVVRDLGLPVKFIGIGEKITDLRDFQAELFVDALLGNDMETSEKLKTRMSKMMKLNTLPSSNANGNTMTTSPASFSKSNTKNGNDENTSVSRLKAAFAASSDEKNEVSDDLSGFGTTTISIAGKGSYSSSSTSNSSSKSKKKGPQVAKKKKPK